MRRVEYPSRNQWENLFQRAVSTSSANEAKVIEILRDVQLRKDIAVLEYTRLYDQCELTSIRVTEKELFDAQNAVSLDLKEAIQIAMNNIERFHQSQHSNSALVETMPGVRCWRKSVGIEKVGLYIPGGSAPLFSTVLMLALPARIAGCKQVILCSPPDQNGNIHPAILYAAKVCGVKDVFKLGGVQAIAAMRYGTETIPAVSKIFGPGNSWVTLAKQLIAKDGFPIDIPAGPSELAIYADATVPSAYVAADLLSQAEHGTDSQVVLVATERIVIDEVLAEVELQLEQLPRKEIARASLKQSLAVLVNDDVEAIEFLNAYAPEHLILACADATGLSDQVVNAGSVFLGAWSPESAGDYASGTNHTLPTNGHAMGWSGVSVDSFVRKITFQEITREGLHRIASTVEVMAEAEGLHAHKNAVTIRMNDLIQ